MLTVSWTPYLDEISANVSKGISSIANCKPCGEMVLYNLYQEQQYLPLASRGVLEDFDCANCWQNTVDSAERIVKHLPTGINFDSNKIHDVLALLTTSTIIILLEYGRGAMPSLDIDLQGVKINESNLYRIINFTTEAVLCPTCLAEKLVGININKGKKAIKAWRKWLTVTWAASAKNQPNGKVWYRTTGLTLLLEKIAKDWFGNIPDEPAVWAIYNLLRKYYEYGGKAVAEIIKWQNRQSYGVQRIEDLPAIGQYKAEASSIEAEHFMLAKLQAGQILSSSLVKEVIDLALIVAEEHYVFGLDTNRIIYGVI